MVQESIKLQFGTYTGEVKDGKPHGHGACVFNNEDIQVRYHTFFLMYTDLFIFVFRNVIQKSIHIFYFPFRSEKYLKENG